MQYTLRRLLASPGFTLTALLTLALGIGANTTMFSVLRAVTLRTLPFADGDRLMHVHRTTEHGQNWPHSVANFIDLRAQQSVFEHIAALNWATFNLALPGEPAEQVRGFRVTADFFPLLGVAPALGRVFTAEENQPGRDRVVVLSHRFWTTHFARDPEIIGREIRMSGESVTVTGVMPPTFEDPLLWGQVDAWRPLAFSDAERANRRSNYLRVIARLKPGHSRERAEVGLRTLWSQVGAPHELNAKTSLRLAPLDYGSTIDEDGQISWFIMALAGLVLLIACANLANLQFARTAARAREHAIRTALGATRARLIRDVLGESLVLALAGGALGVLFALWCNDLLGRHVFVPPALRGIGIPLNAGVLVFAFLVSATSGVAFGLLPAWLATRTQVSDALKLGARSATASRAQHRVRHALIVIEVALALVLLATASLFVRGLQRVAQRDPGWRVDRLLGGYFSIQSPPTADTPEKRTTYRRAFVYELEQKLAALPGVEHVGFGTSLPTFGFNNRGSFIVEGRPRPPTGAIPLTAFVWITPDYFRALGLRLIAGRAFTADDRADAPAVTIINETMARALFPGENPIGKRLGDPVRADAREIVGVVRDALTASTVGLDEPGFQTYRPFAQNPQGTLALALRTRAAPETLVAEVRRIVARLNPEQPINNVSPVRRDVAVSMQNIRLAGWMLGAFAFLGLLLAAIGIYAVIANSVVRRTNEIGIRLALGAQVRDILTLVLGQGLRLAAIGTVLGLGGAIGAAQVLRSTAPALSEMDVTAIAAAVALIIAVATFACWLPARRATKLDPIAALRAE